MAKIKCGCQLASEQKEASGAILAYVSKANKESKHKLGRAILMKNGDLSFVSLMNRVFF
jgi:hypothetical protein